MKTSDLYGMLLAIVLLFGSGACSQAPDRTFKTEGNSIKITSPGHEIDAVTRDDIAGSFLVVKVDSLTFPESLTYIDAVLSMIAIDEAEKSKQEVLEMLSGVKETPAGHHKFKILNLRVIASDGAAIKGLEKVRDITENNLHPVIEISTRGIRVMKLVYNGSPVYLSGDVAIQYILDVLEIKEKNFQ